MWRRRRRRRSRKRRRRRRRFNVVRVLLLNNPLATSDLLTWALSSFQELLFPP
jgi:hypothetical protein